MDFCGFFLYSPCHSRCLPACSTHNSISFSCCILFRQEFGKSLPVADPQQVVWRIPVGLQVGEGNPGQDKSRSHLISLGNDWNFSHFLHQSFVRSHPAGFVGWSCYVTYSFCEKQERINCCIEKFKKITYVCF